ncbi:MAG: hypothetical protein Q8K60_00120 [Parachlamydiaceae bacterium]|nr:hypothetical protein [Parachlamydiaceae bacterium]
MCQNKQSCCCSSKGCGCNSSGSGNCGCQSSCSSKGSCCGDNCGHKNGDCAQKFLELADQAWIEVLKEKIKDDIRANDTDKKLDALAKLISQTNHEKWKMIMAKNQECSDFHEKLDDLMNGCSSGQCKH